MPPEMGYDYIGMSFQEQKAAQGVSPAAIFALSFLFVFLILAALYESWSLPFSVLLGTPIAVLGAFAALLVAADGEQCLCADRVGHAHRAGGQERHSDRRVRPAGIREGQTADRSGLDRRPSSPAADPDDFLRLHSRLDAVVVRHRGGGGFAARPWHGGHRRHAGRHLRCGLPDSGDVLRGGKGGKPLPEKGAANRREFRRRDGRRRTFMNFGPAHKPAHAPASSWRFSAQ